MRPPQRTPMMRRPALSAIAFTLSVAPMVVADVSAPIPAIVQHVMPHRPVVALHVGVDDGVEIGDRCVILEADRPIAAGTVFYVESRSAGVRLAARAADLRVGQAAFVIPLSITQTRSDRLPPFAPRYADVVAVAPGGHTAWLDIGTIEAIRDAATAAVIRDGVVARLGHIADADDVSALVVWDQRSTSSAVSVGDRVRISSADADAPLEHVREAFVTDVASAPEGQRLVLSGASAIDFAPDRRVDLFRGETYVGFATVMEPDAGQVVARTEPSFCQTECRSGDTARLRPPADIDGVVRRGWAFIVDRNYALISLGANDGIEPDDRLFGPSGARPMLELVVQSVYPDHCGAALAEEPPQTGSIPLWGEFRNTRIEDTAPRLGRVLTHPLVPWLAEARLDDDAPPPAPGTLLTVGGASPAVVVVIDSRPGAVLLYTPSCWRLDTLEGRPVRLAAPNAARANERSVIEMPSAEAASSTPPSAETVSTSPPPEADAP